MGNDGFDVSCLHASWVDNTSIFTAKVDTRDNWWDTDEWGKPAKKTQRE